MDTPNSIHHEFADIAAVVDAVGGPVDLVGHSYGGICALEATLLTDGVRRLVLYEPPVVAPPPSGAHVRLVELLAQGRRREVVEAFFREVVRMPAEELERVISLPSWSARVAAAHTIVRELRVDDGYEFDPGRFADLAVPTLLLAGGHSPPFLKASTEVVATALPDTRVVTLEGQGHVAMDTVPDRFAAEILAFLRAATP